MIKKTTTLLVCVAGCLLFPSILLVKNAWACIRTHSLVETDIAAQLGWVNSDINHCGGYYLEPAFITDSGLSINRIEISSDQGLLFSMHGTSVSQGKVTITRGNQQIIANKARIFRDPKTGKINLVDFVNNVTLREPDNLVIAQHGSYNLETHDKCLEDILYRTAIYTQQKNFNKASNKKKIIAPKKPPPPTLAELEKERHVDHLSAWGKARKFFQSETNIFHFQDVSFTTCPPLSRVWEVQASDIELNRNTGRGTAKNAKILVKNIPIFYTPILNFPIDHRRQTGFLAPTFGISSKLGPYFTAPFYWNLAPNYDTTITPAYSEKRGAAFTDLFRYLTPYSHGQFRLSVVPHDHEFENFQEREEAIFANSTDPHTIANLRLLENSSATRGAFSWQDVTHYNERWSSKVDYNYVSDDYYLRDFSGNNIKEVTQNQLLQEGDLSYQSPHWNFLGRLQQYQTLHPVDEMTVYQNQYSRFPQLVLDGDFPDQAYGLDYFVLNDFTHFDIRQTPGQDNLPMGNRTNFQPGISWPLNLPYLFFNPRIQYELTQYSLGHVLSDNQKTIFRSLPIFDISTIFYLDREVQVFGQAYRQTLEPQFYYTYIPYRNQDRIPLFDTTINTLTYDQLFEYNLFSSIDRINDANRLSVGLTTRLMDQQSGFEKLRAGLGEIINFSPRRVTLCSDTSCADNPLAVGELRKRSPISGMLLYNLNPVWSLNSNTIYNINTFRVDNQNIALHYRPDPKHIFNLGYNFVRNGDILPGESPNTNSSNLWQTDISFAWPIRGDWSMVGRWGQNWNHRHFQDILYGLQYDSCCWAMRFVGGRSFTGLSTSNTYQYNSQFYIQFALKGLGNIGTGDPSHYLSTSIAGYDTNFGQDF